MSEATGDDESVFNFFFLFLPSEHEDSAEADNAIDLAELIPRVDISNLITEALLTEMSDKNWKTRNEGLTKVQGKVATACLAPPPHSI